MKTKYLLSFFILLFCAQALADNGIQGYFHRTYINRFFGIRVALAPGWQIQTTRGNEIFRASKNFHDQTSFVDITISAQKKSNINKSNLTLALNSFINKRRSNGAEILDISDPPSVVRLGKRDVMGTKFQFSQGDIHAFSELYMRGINGYLITIDITYAGGEDAHESVSHVVNSLVGNFRFF